MLSIAIDDEINEMLSSLSFANLTSWLLHDLWTGCFVGNCSYILKNY